MRDMGYGSVDQIGSHHMLLIHSVGLALSFQLKCAVSAVDGSHVKSGQVSYDGRC